MRETVVIIDEQENETTTNVLYWIFSGHLQSSSVILEEDGTPYSCTSYTAFGEVCYQNGTSPTDYASKRSFDFSENRKSYFMKPLKSILLVVYGLLLVVSCTSDNEKLVMKEVEHTVTLESFFDETVAEELLHDVDTRIHAMYLDLETGSNIENENSDLFYLLYCGNSGCGPIVKRTECTKATTQYESKPSLSICEKQLKNADSTRIIAVLSVPNQYICLKTCEGNIGWIRYDDDFRYNLNEGEIQLTYFLWETD